MFQGAHTFQRGVRKTGSEIQIVHGSNGKMQGKKLELFREMPESKKD